MYCIHCGEENDPSARFCMACGNPIPKPKTSPKPALEPAAPIKTEPMPESKTTPAVVPPQPVPKPEPVASTRSVTQPKPSSNQPATRPSPLSKSKSFPSSKAAPLPKKSNTLAKPNCPLCNHSVRSGIDYCEWCGVFLSAVQMEICPSCSFTNRPGVVCCESCGESLHSYPIPGQACPACGFSNRLGVNFCEDCGAVLEQQADIPARGSFLSKLNIKKMIVSFAWRQVVSRFLAGTVGGFVLGKIGIRIINYIF
jgi:zinc-ribbon domain/Double zinc ribbon